MTAQDWRDATVAPHRIRLLRGVVVIREDKSIHRRYGSIIVPDPKGDPPSWHIGTVLGMGPPAQIYPFGKPAVDVPHDFKIGDRVFFSWQHNEREHTKVWEDGLPACWIPQFLIHAVLEP
jgi:hypothetical protein